VLDRTNVSVNLKTAEEIAGMRVAGRLASELLDHLTPHVRTGVTTREINDLAHDYMVNVQHTIPATLNYAPPGHSPYPASLCTSINHVVCHGIPGDKKLKDGDIINVDVTGHQGRLPRDTSRMFMVGKPSIQAKRLSDLTYEAMWRGIRTVRPGAHLATSARTSSASPRATGSRSSANSAATASGGSSTRSRKSCITDARAPASSSCRA
jgi:methionyl aminopeptidase